jgi:DNA-binding transcriptional regulator LsrR (DeoR family)
LGFEHSSSISRLLKLASEMGIVRIDIQPEISERLKRNHKLEDRMIKIFNLQHAIVVSTGVQEGSFDVVRDESLHKSLGMALAERLREILRSKDHIGVTGGRATYYTAKALNAYRSSDFKRLIGITITSLGGNVSAVSSALKISIDADDVAYQLSLVFENATLRRLSLPAVVTSRKVKRELIAKGQGITISPKLWKNNRVPVPTLSILGIGVLDIKSGHRFLNLKGYELQPIKPYLSKLIKFIKMAKYCPVGDIGYRLFYIEPPNKNFSLPDNIVKKLKQTINLLNDRIICINEEQLHMITKVLVVGGGPLKVNAIWQVLNSIQPNPLVQELCTDEETAKKLIERTQGANKKRVKKNN